MKVEDMTPKQISNYPGFTHRLNKIIAGAAAVIKNSECRLEYVPIDYENNPNNLIVRVIMYAGQKIFAIISAFKTPEGKYAIKYTPTKLPNKKKTGLQWQMR